MWSCVQGGPGCLPTSEGSSPWVSTRAKTAQIAAILKVASSVKFSPQSGILPCFLAGLNSSLSISISRARASFVLVSLGSITSSI